MSDLSKINFGGTEYNIKDTTARTDVSKKVTASGGDISNTKIVTADNITTEFPVPAANDTAKGFLGKMKKFCTDFNSFKTGVITLGKLVNNGQCTEPGFAMDARYGKTLYDLFAQLNRDLVEIASKDSALADLTAEADKGYNVRRFARTDGNTLNTPYKADLTSVANGFAIISMSSSNVGTIVWIPMGITKIFIINKVSGTWGNWTSTVTNNDYPGYKPLWSGTITTGGTVSIPGIASYNTYAIVSSSYPAVLWGQRWGSKINAFGFDGNASNAFRMMSVILSIDGANLTVIKSKVAAMTFGAVNGSASDLPITNIYGIS